MDLVECIGFDKSKLTPEQKAKLTAFIESQPAGDLLALKVYSNLDTTSEDDVPSGMVAVFRPDALVDPTLISDNMFQVMAISKVFPGESGIKDGYFEGKEQALKLAVDQFAPMPASAKIHHKVTNREVEVWAPEMGGPGSFVGVYSKLHEDHRTKDYFIAARATVPLMVQELKQDIIAEQPRYIDLVASDEWNRKVRYGVHVSRRNVFRAIANAAEACSVSVDRMTDISACLKDANHAQPEMAVPQWVQTTHGISTAVHDGKPAVLITYGVVPASECLLLKQNHFFVAASAYDGLVQFNLSNHKDIEEAGGIPADTGRKVAPEKLSEAESAFVGRSQGVVWDGKNARHVDLHVDAFKPVGPEFKGAMQNMGWNPVEHVQKLVPVALKLYNPALKRQ
jgi:hypothetical protein